MPARADEVALLIAIQGSVEERENSEKISYSHRLLCPVVILCNVITM